MGKSSKYSGIFPLQFQDQSTKMGWGVVGVCVSNSVISQLAHYMGPQWKKNTSGFYGVRKEIYAHFYFDINFKKVLPPSHIILHTLI